MNINLPESLASQLQQRVDASSEFQHVEEYVVYVLSEVLKQTADDSAQAPQESEDEKAEQVKERLKSLGYLD